MSKNVFISVLFMVLFTACKENTVKTETVVEVKELPVSEVDTTTNSAVQHFNFDEMDSETIGAGIKRKWFHGQKGQMTIFNLEKGAHIPWHHHPNEQITYIMSGKVKIKTIIDGKEEFVIVSGGEVIVFPENVPHEFWALEKTVDLDVHVPVRQDWLSKELPDYLKKSE